MTKRRLDLVLSPNEAASLLSTEDAAAVLGVTVDTVARWFHDGLLEEGRAPTGGVPRMFRRTGVEMLRGRRYARRYRGLDLTLIADARFTERFWSKVDKNGPPVTDRPELGNCWVWTRGTTEFGYGQFAVTRGHPSTAHMVSYALEVGPVPAGVHTCHHCDNPPCVRPRHLFLGTPSDNAFDMVSKGRQGDRHPGTGRANARLADGDIRAIRSVPPYYGRTSALSREYGVSTTTIRKILAGQKWRHVA